MTDDQKEAVTRLRTEGLGYGEIASYVGVSANTVKSYCRRNNLTGCAYIKKKLEENERRCKNCGALLKQDPKRKEKLFCSDKCRLTWWNLHQDQVKRKAYYHFICPACGKEFVAYGNAHKKYCCHECYIADRFGRGEGGPDFGTKKKPDGKQRF